MSKNPRRGANEWPRPTTFTGHRLRRGLFSIWFACMAFLIAPCGSAAADVALVDLNDASAIAAWTTINDPVMGGLSTSSITLGDGGLVFSGYISLENNGGFASARSAQDPDIGLKATGAKSLRVRALGDGKTYVMKVGAAGQPWSYIQRFSTEAAVQRVYDLPIEGFQAVGMRLDPAPYAPQTLDPSSISQVAIYILDKQQGPFTLTISAIDATA